METVVKVIFEVLVVFFWDVVAARPFTIFASLGSGFLFGWVGFFAALACGLLVEPALWLGLGIDFQSRQTWLTGLGLLLLAIVVALAGLPALIS